MTVIAEGVEAEAQRGFLRTVGCDRYPGFLFSPPVPEPDFVALVQHQHDIERPWGPVGTWR